MTARTSVCSLQVEDENRRVRCTIYEPKCKLVRLVHSFFGNVRSYQACALFSPTCERIRLVDYCVELLLFVLALCKTTLLPTTETERTLIKSLNFENSFQSLYAWMLVLHGVRSDTQLWTLILQTPAFKQKGRKPFYELKVIRRGGCSFTNSVLRYLQL